VLQQSGFIGSGHTQSGFLKTTYVI